MTRRRIAAMAALTGVALAVFLLLTVLGAGGGSSGAQRAGAAQAPLATYVIQSPHVRSSIAGYTPPRGARDLSQPLPTDHPVAPDWFSEPIARYRAYAAAQLGRMASGLPALERALSAGDREAAKAAWRAAYSTYLHLGAVYLTGEVAELNDEIDGTAGGLEGGASNPSFAGLHRIEYGLWSGAPPRALVPFARRLATAVGRMKRALAHVSITPLEYATRAHEILEDAVRDLLSGADVPFSGEGVLATKAGLEASEEVIATLTGVIPRDSRVQGISETEFAALRAVLARLAKAHGGRLPSNGQLTQSESELLNGTLGGTLEALSAVPGVLETEHRLRLPQIPARDDRTDP